MDAYEVSQYPWFDLLLIPITPAGIVIGQHPAASRKSRVLYARDVDKTGRRFWPGDPAPADADLSVDAGHRAGTNLECASDRLPIMVKIGRSIP